MFRYLIHPRFRRAGSLPLSEAPSGLMLGVTQRVFMKILVLCARDAMIIRFNPSFQGDTQ